MKEVLIFFEMKECRDGKWIQIFQIFYCVKNWLDSSKNDFLVRVLDYENNFYLVLSFLIKFGYSNKASKFEKNLPLIIWLYWGASNFKWKFSSNCVAFSEYPNFNMMKNKQPQQNFFWKTRFKPNLWLFSTFSGPFWEF